MEISRIINYYYYVEFFEYIPKLRKSENIILILCKFMYMKEYAALPFYVF